MHLPHFLRSQPDNTPFTAVTIPTEPVAVTVPLFQKTQSKGKHLLVTAGMDGDEYASIEAVYRLAEKYTDASFSGTLTLVPIINVPGFRDEVSFNPHDRKYPKFVSLGSASGSSSDILVHWLIATYAVHADVWMDLHGGALTEQLIPFDWYYETGQRHIDTLTETIMSKRTEQIMIYETAKPKTRKEYLARNGCAFIISEAGAQGIRSESDINYHTRFVETVMQELEMIPNLAPGRPPHPIRNTAFYTAPYSSLWYPAISAGQTVVAGQKLGHLTTYTRDKSQILHSHHSGIVLWNKIGMSATSRNTLVAIGLSH